MGKQKYFLAAVTEDGKYIAVDEMDNYKLPGRKKIDKYTSMLKKEELITIFENNYGIKPVDFKLEYHQDDANIYYYGIITDNAEFNECLNHLKSKPKADYILKNKDIFRNEFQKLEELIINNLEAIKELYGFYSPMYSRACNYIDNNSPEERDLLAEEFSKYINFRKWLVRDEKPIHIIKPREESKTKYVQSSIVDNKYFDELPNLTQKPITKEDLQEKKERLLEFNQKYQEYGIDKEDTLELPDFGNIESEDVESWGPRKWRKRRIYDYHEKK